MATKTSDDPMDLGGFMQNFVLTNPFRDPPGMPLTGVPNPRLQSYDPLALSPPLSPKGNSDESHSPVSSHSNVNGNHDNSNGIMDDVLKSEFLITDRVGKVMDTPKGHIGSNMWFASALKRQQVPCCRADVQNWLRANFCYVPQYAGVRDTKSLLATVLAEFPQVTGVILAKVMTFTFPHSPKVSNINGGQAYRGLVAKPQPEDYCNMDLLKAVSHVKKHGLVSCAAELYNVPEASVAGLRYWHSERVETPSEDGDTPEKVQSQRLDARTKRRRSKRKKLPKEYCDPDSLSDIDDDEPPRRKKKNSSHRVKKDSAQVQVKEEIGSGEYEAVESTAGNRKGGVFCMLRKLLKSKQNTQVQDEGENHNEDDHENLDTPLVIVKSEPVDPDYGDNHPNESSSKVLNTHDHHSGLADYQTSPLNMTASQTCTANSDETDVDSLRAEISRLQSQLANEESHTAHLKIDIASSKKQVSSLKSTIKKQELSMIELVQDFSSLHEQFQKVTNKFMLTLSQLTPEQHSQRDVQESNPSPTGIISNHGNRKSNEKKWKFHGSKHDYSHDSPRERD